MTDLAGVSVCLVGINYAPETTGIAPYTHAMASAFRDAGAAVHVVTGVPHYPQWKISNSTYHRGNRWDEVIDGIRVTRVRHHVPSTPDLLGRARMESSFMARAAKIVRTDRSGLVIAVTPSIGALAAGILGARGRPLGVLVQDLTGNAAGESGTVGGFASTAIAVTEYAMIRRAGLVGVITPRFGKVLVENGTSEQAIVELPNFTHIRADPASQAVARDRLGWRTGSFLVVHTGNMGMKQGLESVIEAARFSEEQGLGVEFVLVGDGNQREALEFAGKGISTLKFVESVSSADYPLVLAAADALLLNERPGVREMSLPSKLTSYSIGNRPIIAAVEAKGITYEALDSDQAALLVPPGDAKKLLEAAVRLRDDSSLADGFAEAARAMQEKRHSADAAYDRYVTFAAQLRELR
jgi:colanic acid biosynthesis glycosyl transferase WcaI